jgi:hypothetical protein
MVENIIHPKNTYHGCLLPDATQQKCARAARLECRRAGADGASAAERLPYTRGGRRRRASPSGCARAPVCPSTITLASVCVCEQALQVIQVYSESVCSSLFYCITLGLPSCAVSEDTRWLTFKGLLCLPSSPLCRRQARGTTKTPPAADAFSPVDSDMPASY